MAGSPITISEASMPFEATGIPGIHHREVLLPISSLVIYRTVR